MMMMMIGANSPNCPHPVMYLFDDDDDDDDDDNWSWQPKLSTSDGRTKSPEFECTGLPFCSVDIDDVLTTTRDVCNCGALHCDCAKAALHMWSVHACVCVCACICVCACVVLQSVQWRTAVPMKCWWLEASHVSQSVSTLCFCWTLHSTDCRTQTNFGDRAFSAAGPRVWNCLRTDLGQPDLSYSRSWHLLKTLYLGLVLIKKILID